jgi:cobalt-precorrin 5A hydrolase
MTSTHIAIWALTPKGATLARCLAKHFTSVDCFLSTRIAPEKHRNYTYKHLKQAVAGKFGQYKKHIFIMATGIVVRTIAPYLIHKTKDPAVVVVDEAGKFAVSLISGHLGGANELAHKVAKAICGQAVITTATDVNDVPAIDLLAKKKRLKIKNPTAIKAVNMALLIGEQMAIYDPYNQFKDQLWPKPPLFLSCDTNFDQMKEKLSRAAAGVLIDDRRWPDLDQTISDQRVLVLRPLTLTVGLGCNRNTPTEEMIELLEAVFNQFKLSMDSIEILASVDLKADEPGLLHLGRKLNLELTLFSPDELDKVEHVPTPSSVVKKHLGVSSVCEAAALLGSHKGTLIVPKQKSRNVTLAVARRDFTSSVSARAVSTTSL